MITGNEPFMPSEYERQSTVSHEGTEKVYEKGRTIRQQFAAMAMQGLCASGFFTDSKLQKQAEGAGGNISQALALSSVDLADALIAELNK